MHILVVGHRDVTHKIVTLLTDEETTCSDGTINLVEENEFGQISYVDRSSRDWRQVVECRDNRHMCDRTIPGDTKPESAHDLEDGSPSKSSPAHPSGAPGPGRGPGTPDSHASTASCHEELAPHDQQDHGRCGLATEARPPPTPKVGGEEAVVEGEEEEDGSHCTLLVFDPAETGSLEFVKRWLRREDGDQEPNREEDPQGHAERDRGQDDALSCAELHDLTAGTGEAMGNRPLDRGRARRRWRRGAAVLLVALLGDSEAEEEGEVVAP